MVEMSEGRRDGIHLRTPLNVAGVNINTPELQGEPQYVRLLVFQATIAGCSFAALRMNDERNLCFVPPEVQVNVLHPKKTRVPDTFSGA